MTYREIQRLWSNRLAVVAAIVVVLVLDVAIVHVFLGKPVWTWRSSDMLAVGVIGGSLAALATGLHLVRLTVTVSPTLLEVALSFASIRRIETGRLVAAEAVSYRPWREYAGWGVREPNDPSRPKAITIAGHRGVVVRLDDGTRLLVGSRRPEALANAIRSVIHPPGPSITTGTA